MRNKQLGIASNKTLFLIFSIVCTALYFTNPERSQELGDLLVEVVDPHSAKNIRYGASPKGSPILGAEHGDAVHQIHENHAECKAKPAVGNVALQQTKGVYAWVDEKGVKTFSDVKPNHMANQIVVTSKDALDFFDLNVFTPNQNYLLRNQIESRLYAVFRSYSAMLGIKNMQRVQLEIEVVATREQYQTIYRSLGYEPKNSVGFYDPNSFKAYVLYQGEQQTIKTAIHEAVHVINHTLLGQTPRWLNEGLAEYFEEIRTQMQFAEVAANSQWTDDGYIRDEVIAPNRLLEQLNNRNYDDVSLFYRSSWSLVHFLMNNQYQSKMKALLLAEQVDPCSILSKSAVANILGLSDPRFSDQYQTFTQSNVQPHRL